MATRQIVVTRPVRTLDKYKTEKKAAALVLARKAYKKLARSTPAAAATEQ
jgi:hypothetical protein